MTTTTSTDLNAAREIEGFSSFIEQMQIAQKRARTSISQVDKATIRAKAVSTRSSSSSAAPDPQNTLTLAEDVATVLDSLILTCDVKFIPMSRKLTRSSISSTRKIIREEEEEEHAKHHSHQGLTERSEALEKLARSNVQFSKMIDDYVQVLRPQCVETVDRLHEATSKLTALLIPSAHKTTATASSGAAAAVAAKQSRHEEGEDPETGLGGGGGGSEHQFLLYNDDGDCVLVNEQALKVVMTNEDYERMKAEEMRQLASNVHDIRELESLKAKLLAEQQIALDSVEGNAEAAQLHVNKGLQQLKSASKWKLGAAWFGGAVVGGLLCGPVGFVAGAKTAGSIVAVTSGGAAVGAVITRTVAKSVHKANTSAVEEQLSDEMMRERTKTSSSSKK